MPRKKNQKIDKNQEMRKMKKLNQMTGWRKRHITEESFTCYQVSTKNMIKNWKFRFFFSAFTSATIFYRPVLFLFNS